MGKADAQLTETDGVRWPDRNHPGNSSIHVRNELNMTATPSLVWAWLVRAPLWPNWYENASDVRIAGPEEDLTDGSRFRWKTMGITVSCKVTEYIFEERIAWSGRAFGIEVHHAWVLTPSNLGCKVLTEETQRGWPAILGKLFLLPRQMHAAHQLWLEGLQCQAQSGSPPSATDDVTPRTN